MRLKKVPLIFLAIEVLGFLVALRESRIDSSYFTSIYSSNYQKSWDTTDRLKLFQNIHVSSKNDVFVAASENGILIIRDDQIILSQPLKSFVQDFFITRNGRFIFVEELSSLIVYEFIEEPMKKYRLERIFEDKSHSGKIISVAFVNDESRAIVAFSAGLILLLDISQIESRIITIIDQTNLSGKSLRNLSMNSNAKWVLITDYEIGTLLLRWKEAVGQIDSTIPKNKLEFDLVFQYQTYENSKQVFRSDGRFGIFLNYWAGLMVFDFKSAQDAYESADLSTNSFPVQGYPAVVEFWWPTEKSQPNSSAISFSRDESLLAVAERSVAVYIVDIRDPVNPQLFQQIQTVSFSMSTAFSKDSNEMYLYYSNGVSVLQFLKQTPNLNIEIPNLYNVHRSTRTIVGINRWGWATQADSKREFLFYGDSDDGMYIIDIKKSALLMGEKIHISSYGNFAWNFLLIGKSQEYILFSSYGPSGQATCFDIYDISNRYSPNLLFSIESDTPFYSQSMDIHEGRNLLIFDNLSKLYFIDISDLPNSANVIRIWEMSIQSFAVLNGLAISYDGMYAMIIKRGYAIALLDISDITGEGPSIVDSSSLTGAEVIQPGKYQYTKYMFLSDGLSGIKVIDQTQFPRIVVVSSVQPRGCLINIALFSNGNFGLVSTSDKGQVSLIDLRDILNPTIVSSYQYMKTDAEFVSVSDDGDFLFVTTQKGIVVAPIFSDTYIHTDIYIVLNSETGTPTLEQIHKDVVFQVGQIINFNFIILRPVTGISITSVNYLQDYDVVDLPYWMTYSGSNQKLQMKIVKDSLGENYSSSSARIQKNTIVLKTNRPVLVSDFHFNLDAHDVVTTEAEAQLIWNYLRFIGYLDKRSYVTNLFEYENAFSFTIEGITSSEKLHAHVKVALQESIMFNPIIFSVKASLSINVMPATNSASDSTLQYLQFIETLSEYVQLYFSINKSLGKFVTRSYSGIITSTTDTFDQIKLEGDPISINKVLTSKIEIYIYDPSKSGEISLRLTDTNNYEIQEVYNIEQVQFLQYLPSVLQNPQNRLQEQVNQKFPNHEVDIKTNIDIEFMPTSFTFPLSSSLKYTAKRLFFQEETYSNSTTSIPQEFWLQFQETQFKFSGVATFSDYRETYCFQVNATDSFSWQTDSFCIVASGIPFLVLLNLIIQIIGPILFVIGLDKYKHIIYNIILSKRNFYPDQKLKVGEYFEMRTLFIGQNLIIAQMIFEQFLGHFKKQGVVEQFMNFSMASKLKRRISQLLSDSAKLGEVNQPNKRGSPPIGQDQFSSAIEKTYLDPEDRTVLFQKFIDDLMKLDIQLKLNGNTLEFDVLKTDLHLESNILRACLRNELVRHLLSKDKLSSSVYEDMKLKSSIEFQTQNQKEKGKQAKNKYWYLDYVIIIHKKEIYNQLHSQNSNNMVTNEFLYPRVQLNEDSIEQFFSQFEPNQNHLSELRGDIEDLQVNGIGGTGCSGSASIMKKGLSDADLWVNKRKGGESALVKAINRALIKEVIMFDALGFDVSRSSTLFPNIGESLHLSEHEISSVEAFVKSNKKTYFSKLFRLLNLEYVHLTSHQNRKIPNWINFQLKSNMLLLEGTPTQDDKSEILIRFYDYRQFIVKQFKIIISKGCLNAPQNQLIQISTKAVPQNDKTESQTTQKTKVQILKQNQKSQFDLKQDEVVEQSNKSVQLMESIDKFSEITSFQSTPMESDFQMNGFKFPIETLNSPFAFRKK